MKQLSKDLPQVVAKPALPTVPMKASTIGEHPDRNTSRLLSSLQRLGADVCVKKKILFPKPGSGETTWRTAVDTVDLTLSPGTNLQECYDVARRGLAPAPIDEIEVWLAEVSVITAKRAQSEDEGTLQLAAYTSRLRQYPGDIVRETLKSWSGKWWPTWGELKEILDHQTGPRRSVVDRIHQELHGLPSPEEKDLRMQIRSLRDKRDMLDAEGPAPEIRAAISAKRAEEGEPPWSHPPERQAEIDALTAQIEQLEAMEG